MADSVLVLVKKAQWGGSVKKIEKELDFYFVILCRLINFLWKNDGVYYDRTGVLDNLPMRPERMPRVQQL